MRVPKRLQLLKIPTKRFSYLLFLVSLAIIFVLPPYAEASAAVWPGSPQSDIKAFYSDSHKSYALLGLLAFAAVIDNSPVAQNIANWNEGQQTSSSLRLANGFNELGFKHCLWIYWGSYLLSRPTEGSKPGYIQRWSSTVLRSVVVGLPALWAIQLILGGPRPEYHRARGSAWSFLHPQDHHAASGHAFIGAMPFLAAANLSHGNWQRRGLLGLSILPAMARMHLGKHYIGQVVLGWGLAYLSAAFIKQEALGLQLYPLPKGVGLSLQWQA
jgi:hypothetical protein